MVGSTEKVRLLSAAVRCQISGGWFGVEGVPRAKLIQLLCTPNQDIISPGT